MPVANIVKYLGDKKAAKRPSWGGYVRRDNTVGDDGEVFSYKVTIVQRDGDQYVFEFVVSTGKWTYLGFIANNEGEKGSGVPVSSTPLVLEKELFEATMIADDWVQGDADDFEEARTGSGEY